MVCLAASRPLYITPAAIAEFSDGFLLLLGALLAAVMACARTSTASASQTGCFSYAYACTPGYDATNSVGGWAWKYYGGSYAETPTGYHNCTLYAAWRLEQNGVANPGLWGNAVEWINHTSHNNTPAVGAIAWWGKEVGGGFGHVAYVEQVRGSEVFIRADNYDASGGYTDAGWIPASSVDAFLHPHDLTGPPPPPPPPPGTDNGGSRIVGVGSGRCLDVIGGGMSNGTGLQLWDCIDDPQQHWVYWNGQLQVYGNYGKCLDANSNEGGANGTRIQIYECNGGKNQQWIAEPDGSLRSAAYGRCLDAVGGGSANGTGLQLWECSGVPWQHWIGPPAPNGGGRVQSLHSNKCLDVPGASISPGARVQLWECNGFAQQQWVYEGTQLRVYADKCLDAVGGGTTNGTSVQIWYCNGDPQQQWSWGPDGTIRSNPSGLCLDSVGGGTANGTTLQLWECSGAPWQAWFPSTETTPTVSITLDPAAETTSGAATFGFTGADAGSPPVVFLCALDGASPSPCSSPVTYSGLAVGTHTFSVWSQNMVGHQSPPATYTWKVAASDPVTLPQTITGSTTMPSHGVLGTSTHAAAKTKTSPLFRALAKCRKIKNRRKRAKCEVAAKRRYHALHKRKR